MLYNIETASASNIQSRNLEEVHPTTEVPEQRRDLDVYLCCPLRDVGNS